MMKKMFFFLLSLSCSSFAVNWTFPPVYLSSSIAGENADEQDVAMYGNQVVSAWRLKVGSKYNIQTSYSSNGGQTWSVPFDLDVADEINTGTPDVGIVGNQANIIWFEVIAPNYIVKTSHSEDGGVTWSTPYNLSVGKNDVLPQVGMRMNGSVVIAVWRVNSTGTIWRIQSTYSLDGGKTWPFLPQFVSSDGVRANNWKIAIDGNSAIIVWNLYANSPNNTVQAVSSFDGGQSWTSPKNLSLPGYDAANPQIAISGNQAVCVWERSDGSKLRIQTAFSTDGGQSWASPKELSAPLQNATLPKVAIFGNHVVAIWTRYNGSHWVIQTSSSQDGGQTWSSTQDLSDTTQDSRLSAITINEHEAIAVWLLDNEHLIQSSYSRDVGLTWSEPISLSSANAYNAFPSVTCFDDQAVALWQLQEPGVVRLQALSGNLQLPITIEVAKREKIRSLLENGYFNVISWKPEERAVEYRAFTDSALTNKIFEGKNNTFYDPISTKESKTYYIVWVDALGVQSRPAVVTIF